MVRACIPTIMVLYFVQICNTTLTNTVNKSNNKITELRTILQRESQKNSEQSYKGKVKTHKYINRQNQSTTGNLSYVTFQRVTEIGSLRHMATKYRCK